MAKNLESLSGVQILFNGLEGLAKASKDPILAIQITKNSNFPVCLTQENLNDSSLIHQEGSLVSIERFKEIILKNLRNADREEMKEVREKKKK